jgi:hypothetical protein
MKSPDNGITAEIGRAARGRQCARPPLVEGTRRVDEAAAAALGRAAMPETDKPADKTDALPDRLSLDPRSQHFDSDVLERGVGIRFNGQEKTNVEEYCVSEGWVRLALGNRVDRKGKALTVKLQGPVEPYFQND